MKAKIDVNYFVAREKPNPLLPFGKQGSNAKLKAHPEWTGREIKKNDILVTSDGKYVIPMRTDLLNVNQWASACALEDFVNGEGLCWIQVWPWIRKE